jgi:hypothetical protein
VKLTPLLRGRPAADRYLFFFFFGAAFFAFFIASKTPFWSEEKQGG